MERGDLASMERGRLTCMKCRKLTYMELNKSTFLELSVVGLCGDYWGGPLWNWMRLAFMKLNTGTSADEQFDCKRTYTMGLHGA